MGLHLHNLMGLVWLGYVSYAMHSMTHPSCNFIGSLSAQFCMAKIAVLWADNLQRDPREGRYVSLLIEK
jgi:hypothetical protein